MQVPACDQSKICISLILSEYCTCSQSHMLLLPLLLLCRAPLSQQQHSVPVTAPSSAAVGLCNCCWPLNVHTHQ
jgi:hypothetical protein